MCLIYSILLGLPHAHILLIMRDDCKVRTATDVDAVASAVIPDPQVRPWVTVLGLL